MRFTLSVVLLALPLAAWAQSPLTEAEAVRQGLSRTELADLERGRMQAAEADVLAAGQFANPTLSYGRERIDGAPDTVEQSWMISQPFDFSGRRGLHREAAEVRAKMTEADNAARRLEAAAAIRRAFHDVLHQREGIRATEAWASQFARLEGMVDKLARAGEASGYDRRRLARERRDIEARLAGARAELERAQARLAARVGVAPDLAVAGELLPAPLPPVAAGLAGLELRPDLRALSRRAEAADLDGRAAQRGAIPEVTLGIGQKSVDNGVGRDDGLAFAVSLPLPIFDRQQAGRHRAQAEARQARAEQRLARAQAEGELQGVHRQAESLRAAALDYRAQAVAANRELLVIAEAAYQGGESSLLELLDAHRGALETELAALELEKRARDARIEYDLLTGSVDQ